MQVLVNNIQIDAHSDTGKYCTWDAVHTVEDIKNTMDKIALPGIPGAPGGLGGLKFPLNTLRLSTRAKLPILIK
jgi:hypothetical protein